MIKITLGTHHPDRLKNHKLSLANLKFHAIRRIKDINSRF